MTRLCLRYSCPCLVFLGVLSFRCYADGPKEETPRLYVESGINHSARSVAWSIDGRFIAGSGIDRTIRVWSVSPARELLAIENEADIVSLAFVSNDRALLTLDADGIVKEWNLIDQRLLGSQRCSEPRSATSLAYSTDRSSVLCADSKTDSIREWNLTLTKEYPSHTIHTTSPLGKLTFSEGGRLLTGLDQSGILHILDAPTGTELNTSRTPLNLDTVSVASKVDRLAAINSTVGGHIEIWSGLSEKNGIAREQSLNIKNAHAIAFSFDERTLAYASEDGDIVLLDVASWNERARLSSFSNRVERVGFVPDSNLIAIQLWYDSLVKWSPDSGSPVYDGELRNEPKLEEQWSETGQVFGRKWLIANLKTSISLQTSQQTEVARVVMMDKLSGWVAVTSEGRFDTNMDLDGVKGVHWVLSGNPFSALPVEIFMRDYYEPGLLPRLLACKALEPQDPQACAKEFKPVRSLASLNRVQPLVEVHAEWKDEAAGIATVRVLVKSNSDSGMKNGKTFTKPYDLRLFRDGQLVGYVPKTSVEWQLEPPPSGPKADERDLARWRDKTEIRDLGKDGSKELTFPVQVPRRADLKRVVFTAYAFNEDRVKSGTASATLVVDKPQQPRKGRAYLISAGVNRTESSPKWDLHYAANDARQMSKVLGDKLEGTRQFADVVRIRLVSDTPDQHEAGEAAATKAHLQAVLDVLAGRRKVDEPLQREIPGIERATKAQPEDLVLLSFSSHGYTDTRGVFHIVLEDIGKNTPQDKITAALQQNSLSSDVLSGWLRDVDAGEMTMIVDACHSEATVAAEGFKPGPMGSRGLGQLAYDKGMRILAASKSNEEAMEVGGNIKQGLLSYALVEEGLVEGKAAKDGKVLMSGWLTYGEQEVPNLYKAGKVRGPKGEQPVAPNGRDIIYLGSDQTPPAYQQPVLFDFNKQNTDTLISAK
jgi:WD40 domain-containing protein